MVHIVSDFYMCTYCTCTCTCTARSAPIITSEARFPCFQASLKADASALLLWFLLPPLTEAPITGPDIT